MAGVVLSLLFLIPSVLVSALNNGVARTPPLGWMDWMYFTTDIDEALIRRTADEMAAGGYRDAGYAYVSIDAGISAGLAPGRRAGPNAAALP